MMDHWLASEGLNSSIELLRKDRGARAVKSC